MSEKLDKIFQKSPRIPIDDNNKIVIMSDCHRGIGDHSDNFIKNRSLYETALLYYYNKGFTYIELGDGDEMWEVKNYRQIININLSTFKQLKKFYNLNRLIIIYGNHDIFKKSSSFLEKYFYHYYNKLTQQEEPFLNGLKAYEALILTYQQHDIFLIHGHQVDFLNDKLWPLSKFLVRYVWRLFEFIGIKAPISAAKNHPISKKIDKKLNEWTIQNNKILIAGHTHRAIFPKLGQSLYFNTGSCVYPNEITCIEIEKGNIALIKWELLKKNESVSFNRKALVSKVPLTNFFK